MITIVGFAGSLRQGSYNAALLRAAGAMMPPGSELHEASIREIPLYDGDDEAAHGVPAVVTALKDAIAAADGLLLATPEYNNAFRASRRMPSTGSADRPPISPGYSAVSPLPSSVPRRVDSERSCPRTRGYRCFARSAPICGRADGCWYRARAACSTRAERLWTAG